MAPAPGVPPLGPSGASAHLRGVAWAMQGLGHELRVVAAQASDRRGVHGEMPVPVEAAGVPGWPSWLKGWRERREAWVSHKVARLALRGPAPELIYERWSLFAGVGAAVRAKTGAPWVLEVNAPLLQERERFEELLDRPYAEAWQRRTLLGADRVVAVSRWVQRWLVEEIGVPAARVRYVPNGAAQFEGDRAATRAALGLQEHFVLGFLGSMKPWHGVESLLGLLERLPDARALLVGGGAPEALVGHPRVLALGQVGERRAAELVAAMDVGLAPYPADAPPWFCPLKVLAYRAQGTPVVGTAVGELPELVGEGGEVVPAGDPDALAAACARWRGRRAAPRRRSWEQVVGEALEGLF
ncbi:MAG: glycosyltransferase family 4 protein [Alphaproteobacteria bacterium]|nr:glycosyltransferase family 4 protein [Alphaproteobacteria bacterium]MCB9791497.1 glycosyltransferase family 4 protein [Alphaproteobacteria bacterium]